MVGCWFCVSRGVVFSTKCTIKHLAEGLHKSLVDYEGGPKKKRKDGKRKRGEKRKRRDTSLLQTDRHTDEWRIFTVIQVYDSGPLSQRSAHAEEYAQTKTNTNPSPDPNRYRRRCPDLNARIQKFIHYMAIAAICDSGLSQSIQLSGCSSLPYVFADWWLSLLIFHVCTSLPVSWFERLSTTL